MGPQGRPAHDIREGVEEMTGRNAFPSHAAIRSIIENAIRDEARRGNHGYDELARAVHAALERNHVLDDPASRVKLT